MDAITTMDTRADAHAATKGQRVRLQDALLASLREAHRRGTEDLSRRELRDFHAQITGQHVETASVASSVNALLVAGKLVEGVARLDPQTGRLVKPVRCKLQQARLVA